MCCDSAHKTLPVLTGGAYLHISRQTDPCFSENARSMLSVFASTSPSYLTLASLDLCNHRLAGSYARELEACIRKTEAMKQKITQLGFVPEEGEPLKLVVNAKKHGLTGHALAELLRAENAEPEFYDAEYLVLMLSTETRDIDCRRVVTAFEKASGLRRSPAETADTPPVLRPEVVMSPREALFAPQERIPAECSAGRVCAAPSVSCPPAVPVVVSGERIPPEALPLFAAYGVDSVPVVRQP